MRAMHSILSTIFLMEKTLNVKSNSNSNSNACIQRSSDATWGNKSYSYILDTNMVIKPKLNDICVIVNSADQI